MLWGKSYKCVCSVAVSSTLEKDAVKNWKKINSFHYLTFLPISLQSTLFLVRSLPYLSRFILVMTTVFYFMNVNIYNGPKQKTSTDFFHLNCICIIIK